jgi:hypothetical protein
MKTQNGNDPELPKSGIATPKVKRPYNKPTFRFERVFETSALSCGKIIASQAGCRLNRKNS